MADYGKAIKEVREVFKRNGVKEFAVQMDNEASTYSWEKNKSKENSILGSVIGILKERR